VILHAAVHLILVPLIIMLGVGTLVLGLRISLGLILRRFISGIRVLEMIVRRFGQGMRFVLLVGREGEWLGRKGVRRGVGVKDQILIWTLI
jgi:hypothetical protein